MEFFGDKGLDAKSKRLKRIEHELLRRIQAEDDRFAQQLAEHNNRKSQLLTKLVRTQNLLNARGVRPSGMRGMVVGQETAAQREVRRQMTPEEYFILPRGWG